VNWFTHKGKVADSFLTRLPSVLRISTDAIDQRFLGVMSSSAAKSLQAAIQAVVKEVTYYQALPDEGQEYEAQSSLDRIVEASKVIESIRSSPAEVVKRIALEARSSCWLS
jgi:hypothetical protein